MFVLHHMLASLGLATMLLAPPALAQVGDAQSESWNDIRAALFDDRPIIDDGSAIAIEAPARAPDPAMVPVTITLGDKVDIKTVTLVVDENPAPVAATFTLGEAAGLRAVETRLRVNAYSNVRAIAETRDGTLYEAVRYVKASGGCAAPAARNPEEAARLMGEMRLRRLMENAGGGVQETQLMIRHPNNSGLQRDQITHLYIPAHFVSDLQILLDDKPFLTMSGGISISEDPNFRFRYDGPDGTFKVIANDTEGQTFVKSFAPGES